MAEFCLDCFNRINGEAYTIAEVELADDFCEGCGRWLPCVMEVIEPWKLYTKEYGNGRKEYRYGPEWVSMQLFMEGGYSTPEEAKAAWLRECEGK